MFREIKNIRQEPGLRRRWFEAGGLELVVWYDGSGVETGFQLLYSPADGDRALTWRRGSGFSHHRVDSGEGSPLKNMTPILVADGALPWTQIEELFQQHATSLEPRLRDLVLTKLADRKPEPA